MASELAQAYVQIIPSAKGISAGIASAIDPEAESAGKSAGGKWGQKFAGALKGAGTLAVGAIGAASGAIAGLAKIGMDYNTEMETYTTNFETMLGSQEAAVAKVAELKKFAASTPLSMADLSQGTQTLLAFGISSDQSTERLRQLGDIALGDSEKMQRLVTAFGKASAAGKVQGDVIASMTEAGFNPLLLISERTGESMEDLQKRMSAGKLTVAELEQAMADATSEGGQFAGGMEKASQTTVGLMSTLQDNARALVGEVFQPLSDGLLQNLLPTAISSIEGLTTAFREGGVSGMISAAGDIVGNVLTTLANGLPGFVDTAVQLVGSLVGGIGSALPAVGSAALQIIKSLAGKLVASLPTIIAKGKQMLTSLINGIRAQLPQIGTQALNIVAKLAAGIASKLPTILQSGITLLGKFIAGIIQAIPKIPGAISKVISTAKTAFGKYDWSTLGRNIITGVVRGLKAAGSAIKNALMDLAKSAYKAVKNFFGIRSPSRLMRDQIGKYIPKGMALGIEQEAGVVDVAMRNLSVSAMDSAAAPMQMAHAASTQRETSMADLLAVMERYLPLLGDLKEMQMVLDSGELVGVIDRRLGRLQELKELGLA